MDTQLGKATFDQGRFDAIQLALVTFLNLMKPGFRDAFCAEYAKRVETFDALTVGLPISDEWREGLATSGADLLRLVSRIRAAGSDQGSSRPPATGSDPS